MIPVVRIKYLIILIIRMIKLSCIKNVFDSWAKSLQKKWQDNALKRWADKPWQEIGGCVSMRDPKSQGQKSLVIPICWE